MAEQQQDESLKRVRATQESHKKDLEMKERIIKALQQQLEDVSSKGQKPAHQESSEITAESDMTAIAAPTSESRGKADQQFIDLLQLRLQDMEAKVQQMEEERQGLQQSVKTAMERTEQSEALLQKRVLESEQREREINAVQIKMLKLESENVSVLQTFPFIFSRSQTALNLACQDKSNHDKTQDDELIVAVRSMETILL
jgi:hypothetical protein